MSFFNATLAALSRYLKNSYRSTISFSNVTLPSNFLVNQTFPSVAFFKQAIPTKFFPALSILSNIFLLLYISWKFIRLFISKPLKKSAPAEPIRPIVLRGRRRKTLGIFDSVITFSQWAPQDNYACSIEFYTDPKFSSGIDMHLQELLRSTGKLARRCNDHLEELAIRGFDAMLSFVFPDEENLHDASTVTLVNWQDDDRTCPSTQAVLNSLLNSIGIALSSAYELNKANRQLATALNLRMGIEGGSKRPSKSEFQKLSNALVMVKSVQSNLEYWRRELRLYSLNVAFTKSVDRSGGRRRQYILDAVRLALDKLLSTM
ncbi:hypothetical protein MJO28_006623 [Puccinia striiformis f. sp. tritici]|uniref:Uncharacterized protein n=1 Tax=Puccinia striiformis f. sp. tritici TaxID=168172 RepID=A0ACC0EHK4_9BASI|nr:hypothetical protein MJO28_006623 [Puccinia striiformis f. sp. tritici]